MAWYATKKAKKLLSMDRSRILVFDLETTGLNTILDEILQISILDGDGKEIFSSYIKPKRHRIWPIAQKINGISYNMVKDAPSINKVRKQIQKIFATAQLVVGYNLGFDISFLEAAGIVVAGQRFDVMKEFAKFRSDKVHTISKNCKLTECAEFFGYSYHPHDSEEDARVTYNCFKEMISDPLFMTYKITERKQIEKERPITKKETRFTLEFERGFCRDIFSSLLLIAGGIGVLSWKSGVLLLDTRALFTLSLYAKNNFLSDPAWIIPSVVVIIVGMLSIIIRILQRIVLLPRWITVIFQRFFKM